VGSTRYNMKFVVDLTIDTDDRPLSEHQLLVAVESELRKLSHKRHGIGKVYPRVQLLGGAIGAAVQLVESFRDELRSQIEEAVWSHETDKRHDDD